MIVGVLWVMVAVGMMWVMGGVVGDSGAMGVVRVMGVLWVWHGWWWGVWWWGMLCAWHGCCG